MKAEEKRLAEELLFSEQKTPSFAKQLFFGRFDQSQVMPYPESEDCDEFLQAVRTFSEVHIDADAIDRNAEIPKSVIDGLAKLQVLGMTVPKSFGGLEMSYDSYCRTTEILARHCGSTALYVNVHQSIGMRALLLFGTKDQQDKWLPKLTRGEITAAFSLTEPNAGSDANGVETKAVYDPEKKIYRITGQKQWTTNGGIADVLTVMAKTDVKTPRGVEEKVTAFLVNPSMPGFKVREKALEKVGMRGTWTANLEFDNMEVPEENILGPLGGGLRVCLTVLDFGRVTFGSTCTGVAKELVELAIKHAKDRYQFGRPLGSFPLVKKKIANMCALAYAMESTTYLTASFIDRDVEDFMLEAAMLKVFTSDAVWDILYDTMQIYGGRSFFTSAPFERMMRDARLNMIGEGSNEVLRAFIAAVGMRDVGMELKGAADALKHPWSNWGAITQAGGGLFERVSLPEIPIRSPHLQKEKAMLAIAIRRLSWSVVKLLAKHGEDIVEQQLQLDRISSMAMAIYTSTAVLSRLDRDLERVNGQVEALGHDVAVGQYYCRQSLTMAKRWWKAIDNNRDGETVKLSDQITGLQPQ